MTTMITVQSLVAAGVAPTQARTFAQPLAAACARFSIDTPVRAAAFIGQCVAESGAFQHLEENLYYSSPERVRQIEQRALRQIRYTAREQTW